MMWIEKINVMKKESEMTLTDISEKSGVPKGTLNKIFSGQTKDPQLSSIVSIIHAMGYTLDDLESDRKKAPAPAKAEAGKSAESESAHKPYINSIYGVTTLFILYNLLHFNCYLGFTWDFSFLLNGYI